MKPELTYHDDGRIKSKRWKNEAGELHRLDGPAHKWWYKNGRLESEVWFMNGKLHRLDGLARQYWNNTGHLNCAEYWINGVNYKTEAEFLVAVDLYKASEIAELF